VLNKLRADPQAKPFILARRKEVLARRGITDADARLAEIGKIFDEAMAMPAADFEKNQQQLAQRVVAQMQPGPAGLPPSAAPNRPAPRQTASTAPPTSANIPWIDVHVHMFPSEGSDYTRGIRDALAWMDQAPASKMIILAPPSPVHARDCEDYAVALRQHRDRFAFLGGGHSLNLLIYEAVNQTSVSVSQRREFERKAAEILKCGAVGFGEIGIHHLSLALDHGYGITRPDHPLLLLLADISAKHDVPIDVHCDLIAQDMPKPAWLTSPHNSKFFTANLPAFERFLGHNPKAKICWAHAGSDNTGHWTTELSRRLLRTYPSLYMSLRMGPGMSGQNFPLTDDGQVKPDWLRLFQEFPNRFVIGNDMFIGKSAFHIPNPSSKRTAVFLKALPQNLARKIAYENAIALYKLKN
ncbi:MAG: amidohydrolase family protein, partial [Verrucomicrobia bacterium]|nr:amidohydrolase family protein [Verrucomicrobiota bacterium]